MATVRWGILGPGNIAKRFASDLKRTEGAVLQAIASRSADRAEAFREQFGGETIHTSYEALAEDPNVDIVYVATPHVFHLECSKLCLDRGKPVLCEKPLAINAAQVRDMVECARRNDTFLMEGMWTRFFPIMGEVRKRIGDGAIGEVRMVQADFGFRCGWNPESRLLSPALGGGGLLDVGVYPMSFFFMLLGTPIEVQGQAHVGETGVDEQAAWICKYAKGELAIGATGVQTATPQVGTIIGTEGRITLDSPWWKPARMTVASKGSDPEVIEMPYDGGGFQFEAAAVGQAVSDGLKEHPLMPLDESIAIVETMDSLRAQWGVKYPCEE